MLFNLSIYRLGWYGGVGGRIVLQAAGLRGQAQGYWSRATTGVVNCPTCVTDNQLGLLDTHWRYGYSLAVPADWVSGEYLVRLDTQDGATGYLTFVVRQDQRQSDILAQMAVNTYQAYNKWGGNSLYYHDPHLPGLVNKGMAALKVSFNRPYDGMSAFLIYADIQVIHFLEQRGYDVTYTTSVDLDRDPSAPIGHRAFISMGHDEYWTREMRQSVEQARDAGLNLAFFGGNDVYWQTRLEPDDAGNPRRVMVMYRDATLDPLTETDPTNDTLLFIDPLINWPQNSLTGTIYGGVSESPPGFPWVVAPSAPDWLLANTGLKPGDSIPALAGKECDKVSANGHQPPGLVVVAASPFTTKEGGKIICNSTYYQATSGAAVFNAGTLSWPGSLDGFGHHNPGQSEDQRIKKMMINLLASFGITQDK